MNKAKLKSYAPQARKDFIAAVTARANQLGLSSKGAALDVAPSQPQGDVTVIAGQAWPIKVQAQREQLIHRIQKDGFDHTMEAVAYTWFNRFAALRYMELHDYLGHGHRALSSAAGGLPDILAYAAELAQGGNLPGLRAPLVLEMKLAGNRDGELYRLLLVAQCNALSNAMPFLFERIDDDSELLLPDNLLRSDSVISKLVEAIPEEDWAEVEIIGWLYQFYISEKKDQVIGKVVKSEDIPAATQLFTPNWIVQYLVQNSVGRLWLMANPHSSLASEWPYYITPAEQTPEVQAQLDALIQTRVREDGDTLNPESITVLDPACGSGHILVVAYDVLKAIYLERGYRIRDIPRLILEKNLYGLDIDDRAAQMAGFALLMKARADDRRLFTATDDVGNLQPPKLNVLALQSSEGMNAQALVQALQPAGHSREGGNPAANDFARDDLFPATHPQMTLGESATVSTAVAQAGTETAALESAIAALIETFIYAKTFGSLIKIGPKPRKYLGILLSIVQQARRTSDLYAQAAAQDLLPLLQQAQVLAMQFDAVVANPPYMGSKFYCPALKRFVNSAYIDAKADLYGAFTIRNIQFAKRFGSVAMITIPSWMFLSSFEALRNTIFRDAPISSLVHNGRGVWGPDFGSCAYVLQRSLLPESNGRFLRLFDKQGSVAGNEELQRRFHENPRFSTSNTEFRKIPGSPLAYWMSDKVKRVFADGTALGDISSPRKGNSTSDNNRFLRFWPEVSFASVGLNLPKFESSFRWIPYNKGGGFMKWYGHNSYLIDWQDKGRAIRDIPTAVIANEPFFFQPGLTWGTVTVGRFSIRWFGDGYIFDNGGCCIFGAHDLRLYLLALLNSTIFPEVIGSINPTVNFQSGEISKFPVIVNNNSRSPIEANTEILLRLAETDWNAYERSWDFQALALMNISSDNHQTLKSKYTAWIVENRSAVAQMKRLEEENNRLFIEAYGLAEELTPEIPIEQITLTVNPAYRYGGNLTDLDQWARFREDTMGELISYAIGCMMGRYSLDEPGLIYAHAANVGFEPGRSATFPADADGIVPITDELWFADDASNRIREFLRAVLGRETLEENMAWLAESLGTKASETPDETIRRYIADKFFKDHLQTYKKRPIYWLFSSGKHGAFQALVYLHRYHEGTLARLRAEYVVPLTGKIQSRIEMLQKDAAAASSTAARNKLAKEVEKLKKKHAELLAYDEQLRHYADMRITLDLDDGVKVNYAKFGDLLAEVKAVTGGAGDE